MHFVGVPLKFTVILLEYISHFKEMEMEIHTLFIRTPLYIGKRTYIDQMRIVFYYQ